MVGFDINQPRIAALQAGHDSTLEVSDAEMAEAAQLSYTSNIDDLKNFGFRDETTVIAAGINAKMNEVQAAFGLLQLKYVDQAIAKRKQIAELYTKELSDISGIRLIINNSPLVINNYSYFPIFIQEHIYSKSRDEVYEELKTHGIYERRNFYPLNSISKIHFILLIFVRVLAKK